MQVKRQLTKQFSGTLVSTVGLTAALILGGACLVQSCPFKKALGDGSNAAPNGGEPLSALISGNQGKFIKMGFMAVSGLGIAALAGTILTRKLKQQQLSQTDSSSDTINPLPVDLSVDISPVAPAAEPPELLDADLAFARYAFPIVIPSEALKSNPPAIDPPEAEEVLLVNQR